jgi:hypothetical protein
MKSLSLPNFKANILQSKLLVKDQGSAIGGFAALK